MSYVLGVDLGTTYTAAAISRGGRLAMVELGTRTTTIPSVLYLRPDGTFLVGEPAVRRMLAESDRIAREFKRRFGDETPLLVGGAPFSAEACTAALLSWVVAVVSEREGGPPDAVAVAHPANWGEFRLELLRGVLRQARIGAGALVPEPVAAVAHYAATARVPEGGVVAVYDFGGGTFDAAVVRCTASGFNLLGRPEGIEHLGGVDLDVAVFAHVVRSVGVSPQAGQDTDPELLAALARLRAECVAVKEVLSSDTEAQIAVQLPGMAPTEVRLTRAELEEMIRPSVVRTIDGLQLALDSAGVSPAELAAVLLVGGSSRIPLVGRMVTEALGRPVALDAHPKHPVALGAALLLGTGAVIPTTSSPPAAVAVTPSVALLPSNPDARAPVAVQSAAAHEVAAEVTTATEVVTAT